MPATPLGEQRLRELLDGGGQVCLANRVQAARETRILAAAIVRHFARQKSTVIFFDYQR